MNQGDFVAVLLSLVAMIGMLGLGCAVILSDIRHRRIPNWQCIAIAGLAVPWWLAQPDGAPGQWLLHLGAVLVIAIPLLFLHIGGMIGGGDVKLLLATLLWVPPAQIVPLLVAVIFLGGVVGLGVFAAALGRSMVRKGSLARPHVTVPYGVAIVLGGWLFLAVKFARFAGILI